jgi:hypothetical protein
MENERGWLHNLLEKRIKKQNKDLYLKKTGVYYLPISTGSADEKDSAIAQW